MKIVEEWRPIPDWEGYYEVSNLGEVRSLARSNLQSSPKGTSYVRIAPGKVLVGGLSQHGYRQVLLCKNGSQTTKRVSCLVALAFIGPRVNGLFVDHIDRNILNNAASNLRYVTNQQNQFNSGIWKANKSGARGVCWSSKYSMWTATIKLDGKSRVLGFFPNIKDAADCRAAAFSKAKQEGKAL